MISNPTAAQARILRTAIRLFTEKGYAGTSVQGICAAAGITKPTLYYYFGSKIELYRAVVHGAQDTCHRLMQKAAAQSPDVLAQLTAILETLFHFAIESRDLSRIVFSASFAPPGETGPDPEREEKGMRNFMLVHGILQRGLDEGLFDSRYTAMELTRYIYGVLAFEVMVATLDMAEALTRTDAERIVELFLRGAARQKNLKDIGERP